MEANFIGILAVTQAMPPLLRRLDLSSSLGLLTLRGDPSSTCYSQRHIGYNASKVALNMLTIQLQEALRGKGILINSVSPGFVKTDPTGYGVMMPKERGEATTTLCSGEKDTGRFVAPDGETPW